MLNLDPAKLLVIAVVAVILLGPDKLPQVARQVGAAWRSLNEFRHRMESEVRNSIPDLPSSTDIARLARSPSALLNHLSNMSQDGTDNPATSAEPPGDESPVSATAADAPTAAPAYAPPSTGLPNGNMPPTSPTPPPPRQAEGVAPGDPSLN